MTPIRRFLGATVLGATMVLALAPAQPVGATAFPGPDAFGYRGATITFAQRDISATGTAVSLGDDAQSGDLPIGFAFTFYGTSYTQFRICSNGFIAFGGPTSCTFTDVTIPTAAAPQNFVAGYWDDLHPGLGGTVRYQTLGSAPNRELVVGFYNVQHFGGGNPVDFEIVLREGSNAIEIQCVNCASSTTHTIGIENATGTIGLEVFRGSTAQVGQAWRLDRNLPPVCTNAAASPNVLWPPNHQMVDVAIGGVTDPDGDPFTITVNSVFQDEPVNGTGSGDTAPDATLSPLQVRAERAGNGSGRAYYINFTATDDKGDSCTGTVQVRAPRTQKQGGPVILYDSTTP